MTHRTERAVLASSTWPTSADIAGAVSARRHSTSTEPAAGSAGRFHLRLVQSITNAGERCLAGPGRSVELAGGDESGVAGEERVVQIDELLDRHGRFHPLANIRRHLLH